MIFCLALAVPAAGYAQTLSFYGTPGMVEMPTAEALPDGELALTTSYFGGNLRNTMTFQILPWITGSFRYAVIEDFQRSVGDGNLYDRSFDVHFQFLTEERHRIGLAAGLRDFGGTGIYSSEYVVVTKSVTPKIKLTGGIGWGRLGERNGFTNPLGVFHDGFKTRPNVSAGGIGRTGQLDFGAWFRGDAALFGGVVWQVNERLTFTAEYSSDLYSRETARGTANIQSPFNFGLSYKFRNGVELGAYSLYGAEAGVRISYRINPRQHAAPGGREIPAPALLPRDQLARASWNRPNRTGDGVTAQEVLRQRLKEQGLELEGYSLDGRTALIRIRNLRYGASAQAAGRAARAMANTLPFEVETFKVTLAAQGVPVTTITTQRQDLYELEGDLDGAWRSYARAEIEDAPFALSAETPGAFPRLRYNLGPYSAFSFFDPDSPIRADFGVQLRADYSPRQGLNFAGQLRYPLVGNIADATRQSNSVIQRVRSDTVLYAQQSDIELNYLTAEYMFRPGDNLFGRVTVGYLENMYGGASAEVLWYPVGGKLALGAELNYARQRDFDMRFGFQDYGVITGHASAYYDFGNGFLGQLDVGRYLAGDWGGTVTLTREFNNGFRVGGFFTLTDVPFSDFGEGSFDKGIHLEIPMSWLTGAPSRATTGQTIRPVVRDGGARLNVRNRLFGVLRDYRGKELRDGWARYHR